jgi:hypothetical protein
VPHGSGEQHLHDPRDRAHLSNAAPGEDPRDVQPEAGAFQPSSPDRPRRSLWPGRGWELQLVSLRRSFASGIRRERLPGPGERSRLWTPGTSSSFPSSPTGDRGGQRKLDGSGFVGARWSSRSDPPKPGRPRAVEGFSRGGRLGAEPIRTRESGDRPGCREDLGLRRGSSISVRGPVGRSLWG